MKQIFILVTVMCLLAVTTYSQAKTYVPVRGSVERKTQMDLLRNEFTPKFNGQKLIFEVSTDFYQSNGTWAFVLVNVFQEGGMPVDFKNSKYRKEYEEGFMDSNGIFALFQKTNVSWKLVTYADFPTDVPVGCWWKEYKAPKSVFGSAAQPECL